MKEQIKHWLKERNLDRQWLADQIGVKKRTVDNWLSSPQEIPIGKERLIQRLMQDDQAREAARRLALLPQSQIFSLEVDLPTYRAYSAAALADQRTLEQWAIHELNEAAAASPAPVKRPHTYESISYPSQSAAEASPLNPEDSPDQDADSGPSRKTA